MNNPHKLAHHSRNTAMFCMDYMFMIKTPDDEQLMHPMLVVEEHVTDGIWALPVIRKGTFKNNIIKQVVNILNSVGSPKIIIKTDQEPATVDIQNEVRK